MGLTIHYSLTTELTEPDDVITLVESIRQVARDLPFQEVSELLEFHGPEADFEHAGRDDAHRWLKIQASRHVERGNGCFSVKPLHIIGFTAWPGEGCEPANVGFGRYPAFLEVPTRSGRSRRLATKIKGWCWGSFCKTQYASNPDCDGVPNFLRCHVCVVKLLDFIVRTGLVTVDVRDEGGYWEERNLEKLAREVGDWNEMIAAVSGLYKDQANQEGFTVESAIAGFANFEHLEAKGLERLQRLRQQRSESN